MRSRGRSTIFGRAVSGPAWVARAIQESWNRARRAGGWWLRRRYPNLYARLLKYRRGQGGITALSTTWSPPAVAGTDPQALDLPSAMDPRAAIWPAEAAPGALLEPVLEMGQMRQGAASVCFVVLVSEEDRDCWNGRCSRCCGRASRPGSCSCALGVTPRASWRNGLEVDWGIRRLPARLDVTESQQLWDAAVQATATFMGLLSPGDVVHGDLVRLIGIGYAPGQDTDLVYTDEAIQAADGGAVDPFYKPDWSPEHQCSVNMLGRFVAMRKQRVLELPRPTDGHAEAVEFGLNLATSRRSRSIAHVDEVLYVRRQRDRRPPRRILSPEAMGTARDVLTAHVRQEDPAAAVLVDAALGSLRVDWPVTPSTAITLLILTGMYEREVPGRGRVLVLATNLVESILARSHGPEYRIIVVDDGHLPDDLRALLARHAHAAHTYPQRGPFSFARKANFATSLVTSGIVILLNDDLEVISADGIQALAGQAARPGIGAVGGRLLFADGTLQHAGIGLGFHGSTGHMHHGALADGREYGGFASIARNYSAVTGAVMAYRKDVFDEVGGFDERFGIHYNDVGTSVSGASRPAIGLCTRPPRRCTTSTTRACSACAIRRRSATPSWRAGRRWSRETRSSSGTSRPSSTACPSSRSPRVLTRDAAVPELLDALSRPRFLDLLDRLEADARKVALALGLEWEAGDAARSRGPQSGSAGVDDPEMGSLRRGLLSRNERGRRRFRVPSVDALREVRRRGGPAAEPLVRSALLLDAVRHPRSPRCVRPLSLRGAG